MFISTKRYVYIVIYLKTFKIKGIIKIIKSSINHLLQSFFLIKNRVNFIFKL
jgi:hypothetical protein